MRGNNIIKKILITAMALTLAFSFTVMASPVETQASPVTVSTQNIGELTGTATFAAKKTAKPAKVKTVNVKINKKSVKVTWSKSKGATKYILYKKVKDGTWKPVKTFKTTTVKKKTKSGKIKVVKKAPKRSYTDKKVTDGKVYYYKVVAVKGKVKAKASKAVKANKVHNWTAYKVTKEATFENAGSKYRTCKNCGKKETVTIPALYSADSKKPARGVTEETTEEVPNTGTHKVTLTITPANCTTAEKWHYTCDDCSFDITEYHGDALGHNYSEEVSNTPATCTSASTLVMKCSRCGKQQTTHPDAALGHTFSLTGETWSKDNSKVTFQFACTRDGCTESVEVSKATSKETKTAASCETEGEYKYTITLAKATAKTLLEKKTGETVASVSLGDKETYTETKQVTTEALGHKLEEEVVKNYTSSTCDICGLCYSVTGKTGEDMMELKTLHSKQMHGGSCHNSYGLPVYYTYNACQRDGCGYKEVKYIDFVNGYIDETGNTITRTYPDLTIKNISPNPYKK